MSSAGSEYQQYLALKAERDATTSAFRQYVMAMEHVEGITVEGNRVKIALSTNLCKACGADEISGFEKDETMFEIGLKKGGKLISAGLAMDAGMEDQIHTLEKDELRDFLVKIVNQTK